MHLFEKGAEESNKIKDKICLSFNTNVTFMMGLYFST